MTNDGDLDIWALKWHDNGRPIEIYRYSGSVYKKILWNITKKDRVPELIYNMTNNSNYDFINMYYIYIYAEIPWLGIRSGLLEAPGPHPSPSSVPTKSILKLLLHPTGPWSIPYIAVYHIILSRIILMRLN